MTADRELDALPEDSAEEVVDRARFTDLLTVGGRLYHETHFAPLLRMQGSLGGVALELRTESGGRLPATLLSTLTVDDDVAVLTVST